MLSIQPLLNDFLHLFYPHVCTGCGTDILNDNHELCIRCLSQLPKTHFFENAVNPVEEKFYGRLPVRHAGAAFYFTKQSLIENIIYDLKYKGNKGIGRYMGQMLGQLLSESKRFDDVDIIIPLPLNFKRLKKRGYNQSQILAEGITSVWNKPVNHKAVIRKINTETQTHSGRIARLENMQNVFAVADPAAIQNKHVLLIDDVVTTGASLEACAAEVLKTPGVTISIAALAYTIQQ
ncbi:MAG TPA: ComF family protein [Segetibacter sp.]|jgi:ComF family protein